MFQACISTFSVGVQTVRTNIPYFSLVRLLERCSHLRLILSQLFSYAVGLRLQPTKGAIHD